MTNRLVLEMIEKKSSKIVEGVAHFFYIKFVEHTLHGRKDTTPPAKKNWQKSTVSPCYFSLHFIKLELNGLRNCIPKIFIRNLIQTTNFSRKFLEFYLNIYSTKIETWTYTVFVEE